MKIKNRIQFFLFLFPLLLNSQTYFFRNYGVQDGLAQSNVSAIVQDKSGFIWLATESGLSKFDGINFTNYTTEHGLADNNISALLLDTKGNLWLGHGNGALTKYDGKTFTAIRNEALPADKKIFSLSEDKTGSIWISTETQGAVLIIDPEKNLNDKSNYKSYSGKEGLSQYVFSIAEDNTGKVWFLTDVGIKIFDKKKNQFDFFKPEGMPYGQVTSFTKTSAGNFLIGTSIGNVSEYNPTTQQFETIITSTDLISAHHGGVNNIVYALHQDKTGSVWASIYNNSVCRYTKSTKKLTFFNAANGLLANKIKSISEDREGNILLGTSGEGLEIFKGEKFISLSKKDGLINDQVWSITQDKNNNYWFGTSEGITIYNPTSSDKAFKTISLVEVLGNDNVRTMAQDKAGNIWIGTWGGKIAKYNFEKSQLTTLPSLNEVLDPYISCLLIDSKNKLWVGTANGLCSMDLAHETIHTYRTVNGLSENDITCVFEDSKGTIWIGTRQKGITLFDGTSFKKLNKNDGLTYSNITSIAEGPKHHLWIGTEGGGMYVYENGTFKNYKTKDGLVSDFITLANLDNNNEIWLGTNKGLCKYDEAKNIFLSYSKNDGFTGIETKPRSVYNDKEGNIWFGTVNGVFKYDPKQDVASAVEPLTHITRFRINLKDYPPSTQSIELSYKENSIHFDYIGISISNPDEVTYKVMLEGYDKEWKPVGKQRFEIYSNLSPGNYTFKLIACTNRGICNQRPVIMRITITPPFYATWWFYILAIIVGTAIVFSYIKIRERNLIIEKKILEDKVKERTAEVVAKNLELDEKNKDITASIRYAKRIQDAILPPDEFVRKFLPKTFILFKPKDIVSGDFYWLADKKDMVLFAAVDCTGHGVPGAFMSIVGHNLLDQIVGEHGLTQPAAILNALNKSVSDTLRQSYSEDNAIRDGMDIALCSFDRRTNVLEYAGAYNPLWLIRNGELTEIKADKFPIGNLKPGENKQFTNHQIPLVKGDTVYIFSDGYADQFGGPLGKKFKYSTLKQLLIDIQPSSMEEQGELLLNTIENWRGTLEQVDDVLVIGTRL